MISFLKSVCLGENGVLATGEIAMRLTALTRVVLQAVILAAWPVSAYSLDRQDVVRMVHEKITGNLTNYPAQRQTKTLAGCINWDASTPYIVDVSHLNYYFTAESSDVPIRTPRLMQAAILACDREREKYGSNCECMRIDISGKSVLKVPDSFVEKFVTD